MSFAIKSSGFQTYLAQKATSFLSKELKTKIKINSISITFFDKIALDGVSILDLNKDTLANISSLYCSIGNINIEKSSFEVQDLKLDKGVVKIYRQKNGDFNFDFLSNYFSSDQKTTSSQSIKISLKDLELRNINFNYDDFEEKFSNDGMDYNHIHTKNVNLIAKNNSINQDVFKGEIIHLSAQEKCGFDLTSLSGKYNVSSKGLKLTNLKISTPYSKIEAPKMYLLMNNYRGYLDFVDSVSFDVIIKKSKVNLKDITHFATILDGMNQNVDISAKVSKHVSDLKIEDLSLRFGKKSKIIGTINLPDFRKFSSSFFHEKIHYAYIDIQDIQDIQMPVSSGINKISLDEFSRRLGYFEVNDLALDGFLSEFVIASKLINTSLGSVNVDNGIKFFENTKNNTYEFEKSEAGDYDVKINQFDLGKFLENSSFGRIDGKMFLSGEATSFSNINFTDIQGVLNEFYFTGYDYKRIKINEGKLEGTIFEAKIDVEDDNLNLTYNGFIDFGKQEHIFLTIDLHEAILNNLNLSNASFSELKSNFTVDIFDFNSNKINGDVAINGLFYKENEKQFFIPDMKINLDRNELEDYLSVKSSIADINVKGKMDFNTLINDFRNQFSKVFPAIIKPVQMKSGKKKQIYTSKNKFEYDITFKKSKEVLDLFYPELYISNGARLKGKYSGKEEVFNLEVTANKIKYQTFTLENITASQSMLNNQLNADYYMSKFNLNDSVSVSDLAFLSQGNGESLNSKLTWNTSTKYDTKIQWNTSVLGLSSYKIDFDTTYFCIQDSKWKLSPASLVNVNGKNIQIDDFIISKDNQYISLDGIVSEDSRDQLKYKINDLDLEDISHLFGLPIEVSGKLNSWGYLSDPYNNITYLGDANVENLHLNNNELGDVFLQSQWNNESNGIFLSGDLIHKNLKTFSFLGNYFYKRDKDQLDFDLQFDDTDLKFTNAFMDPEIVSNIEGQLKGRFKVLGEIDNPVLNGRIDLKKAKAKVGLLGVSYGFDGKIESDKYGFYINNMPVTDEEGNSGFFNGTVYHDNFVNWNFDLMFNLEDDYNHRDPLNNWKYSTLDKFLFLNTKYKENEVYYGKAYATGNANIFGYADNLEISVNLKTRKDTKVYFPMYGNGDVDDETDLIEYVKKELNNNKVSKIDLTGVTLDLNIDVTPDAKIRVDLDDKEENVINAIGSGLIGINVSNTNDVSMDGTFNVKQGYYNFVLPTPVGQIKKKLTIEKGIITWTGSPYDAKIDIQTYADVSANFADLTPENTSVSGGASAQTVQCYINLAETLMNPSIAFDIKAPKVTDEGQLSLLNRVKESNDELNRQFFSLLVSQKFLPLQGSGVSGSGAALDVVTNQLNSLLSQLSKGYKLKLNMGSGTTTLGVQKKIGDRVIINGTFGVENASNSDESEKATTSTTNQNMLIGDVNIEYLINEPGTFRINVFNESNDNNTIQQKAVGQFTQGAGVHYQEDFNHFEDFQLAQYFLDIFRKKSKKKFPIKKKRKLTPVPKE